MKQVISIIQRVGLALLITLGMMQLSATAQTTEEFVEALSPDSQGGTVRTRGLGGIQAKASPRQKAMHLTFGLNSAVLSDSAKKTLNQLAAALKRDDLSKYTYRLEGHTCDRGSDALNMDLSRRRAQAAQRYLARNFGFSAKQLEAVWFGESQPVTPNANETERQKNRRVMIVNTLTEMASADSKQNEDIQIRRLRAGLETVIADGATMNQNDSYAVEFKTTNDRFVYIYQKDASGKLTPVFPNAQVSNLDNPLRPNSFYRLPGPGKWFFLDENKGTEEIVLMSYAKPLQNPLAAVREVVAGNLYAAKTRGLGGIHRKDAQKAEPTVSAKPSQPAVVKKVQKKQQPQAELRVFKRYFIHE